MCLSSAPQLPVSISSTSSVCDSASVGSFSATSYADRAASSMASVASAAQPRLSVSPETLRIEQPDAGVSDDLEGFIEVASAQVAVGGQSSVVSVTASTPVIRLSKTFCEVHSDSAARIRIMLDSSSPALLALCRNFLNSPNSERRSGCRLGFVTVRSEHFQQQQEFNVDVLLTRGACVAILSAQQGAEAETSIRSTMANASFMSQSTVMRNQSHSSSPSSSNSSNSNR